MNWRTAAVVGARPITAIAGGLLLAMSFPSVNFWWCAPLAIAAITWLSVTSSSLRAAFGWGCIAGAVAYLVIFQWLSVVGIDAWLALTAYSALWIGATAVATRAVRLVRWWPVLVGALWVLQEALRGRLPLGGFPWARLAFTQADAPGLDLVAVGGTAALTFIVATSGALLAWAAWNSRRREVSSITVASSVAAAVAVLVVGVVVPTPTEGENTDGPAYAKVALIQGGVPRTGLGHQGQWRQVFQNHVDQTLRLAADVERGLVPQPDAVIWPENAVDVDPQNDPILNEELTKAARAVKAPILVGAVVDNPTKPGTLWNIGLVWEPDRGPSQYYVKRHPVPFGEFVPFRETLTKFIGRFDLVPRDFVAGPSPGVLDVGLVRVGDVICFEIAYDGIVADAVQAGGRIIGVQTNNSTYLFDGIGGAAQAEQQTKMSQIRAVEFGRTVVIAATSGVTGVINPAGEVVMSLPLNQSDYLVDEVPLRDSATIASASGPWIEAALSVIAAAGLIFAVARWVRLRRRRSD